MQYFGRREMPAITREEFEQGRRRVFGRNNPDPMKVPFWEKMVRWGGSHYDIEQHFAHDPFEDQAPVWSSVRSGVSTTVVGNHWTISVGGVQGDSWEPAYMIYNDVIVWDPDGRIDIFGYPKDAFPPTDFHTATLLEEEATSIAKELVIIGGLGYPEDRDFWRTPVYVLNLEHFYITALEAEGDCPGWIFEHRAWLTDQSVIRVEGGRRVDENGHRFPNRDVFELDLARRRWTRHKQSGP